MAIVGKTGSGKTYFARYLTRSLKRLVVFDAKASLGSWNLEEWSVSKARALARGEPTRLRVLPPLRGDWSEYLWSIYEAGNCTLYIDEAYAVTPPGKPINEALNALTTRGRERGIGVWIATQRPAWIPLHLLSEADWFIEFRLQMEADRKRMSQLMGKEVLENPTDKYGFWLYSTEWDKPYYYPKLSGRKT